MSSEFAWLTIEQVAPLIAKRKLSPRELLESLYGHIQQHEPRINAFLTMDVERCHAEAVRAESEIVRGRYRGPLH
ncbi:MAG: Asp-tRNA(Asn)/Glu-tRNA(Gln) amidotransferase GatCAB subunit A, partial [Acidobacteria bacterium]|nr:Asp-tRNA(Asn)/Glu-tRNA(Gln) amidotransferase GatCAB subunit A [Acidobacteriota bacterium]